MEDGTDESERFNEEKKDDSSGEDNAYSDVASLSCLPSFDYSERPPPYLKIEEIPSYRWLESHSSFARSEPDEISPRKTASSTSPSVASTSSHTNKRRKNPFSFRWNWWLSPAARKERKASLTSLQEDTRSSDILTGIYQFTFKEIRTATNDFHNILGEGGFAKTFKGFLPRHNQIAVKLFKSKISLHPDELRNAAYVSSHLRHRNITSFLGYCKHKDKFMLIYEYEPNGSLDRLLFSEGEGETLFYWRIRYKICLQTANGLAYLHNERIIHRDIKPSNILLDADFVPKIDDFSLAKRMSENITHSTARIVGTLGYLAPEYYLRGYLTDKTDVFSYGVVILEIVSGKLAFDITKPTQHRFHVDKLHETLKKQGNLLQFVDPRLGSYDEEEALTLLKLSALCTRKLYSLRPSISTVVSVLEGKVKVDELIQEQREDADYYESRPFRSLFSGESEIDDVETSDDDIPKGIYQFTFKEIRTATNDFDDNIILGRGSYTTTYKGFLPPHNQIAVKLITFGDYYHWEDFLNATHVSSRLRHRNISSFLGYCKHNDKFMLIYEYQPNGSLDRLLFSKALLNWRIRHKICLQTANGLTYLHNERIIHRDIKPSNILLDADFVPKIDDFSLAKRMSENITHSTERIVGTFGYVDPEYMVSGRITDKTDVFSYGVVILEIVTGKRALDLNIASEKRPRDELHETLKEQGNLLEFVDPRLGSYDEKEALTLLKLSALCTRKLSSLRPSIHTVVSVLEGKLKVEELIHEQWHDDYEQEYSCFGEEEMDDVETNDDVCTAPPTSEVNIMIPNKENVTQKKIEPVESFSSHDWIAFPDDDFDHLHVASGDLSYNTDNIDTLISVIDAIRIPGDPNGLEGKLKVEELIHEPWQDDYEQEFSCFGEEEIDDIETNDDVCTAPPTRIFEEVDNLLSTREIHEFTFCEIGLATTNFTDRIQGCANVYLGILPRGVLPDGHQIAVKRFPTSSNITVSELRSEIFPFVDSRHPNIARILGLCRERHVEVMLIYEFMQNRTLSRFLHQQERQLELDMTRIFEICLGVAKGLAYLLQNNFIHGDIKPSNILLDEDFNPKIMNLSPTKRMREDMTYVATKGVGAFGYLDPAYLHSGKFTKEGDVYSYGVVILELVSGKRFFEVNVCQLHECLNKQGNLLQFVDPRLIHSDDFPEKALILLEVSVLCTKPKPADRPSITEVVRKLEGRVHKAEPNKEKVMQENPRFEVCSHEAFVKVRALVLSNSLEEALGQNTKSEIFRLCEILDGSTFLPEARSVLVHRVKDFLTFVSQLSIVCKEDSSYDEDSELAPLDEKMKLLNLQNPVASDSNDIIQLAKLLMESRKAVAKRRLIHSKKCIDKGKEDWKFIQTRFK